MRQGWPGPAAGHGGAQSRMTHARTTQPAGSIILAPATARSSANLTRCNDISRLSVAKTLELTHQPGQSRLSASKLCVVLNSSYSAVDLNVHTSHDAMQTVMKC